MTRMLPLFRSFVSIQPLMCSPIWRADAMATDVPEDMRVRAPYHPTSGPTSRSEDRCSSLRRAPTTRARVSRTEAAERKWWTYANKGFRRVDDEDDTFVWPQGRKLSPNTMPTTDGLERSNELTVCNGFILAGARS
ncbi:hypothetical protein K504DRAFT_503040 [Pleomassaria siparia CBS 279.74]|uniref:Uncharacterized protein n=1 Tax=Pleomassaria siparia CBS 279.74 TaxID=1314801 RepID=A0A6G1K9A0_9PLEO|nr:hypothetical protein K504DRAFT_503040 [Pleomassaria siparia CBS 279.74]